VIRRPGDNRGGQPAELALSLESPVAHAPTPAEHALDNNFRVAARDLRRDLVRCMFFLRSICDGRVHLSLGFMDIYSYAEASAGFSRHQAKRMLETAARLRDLPDTRKALAAGEISFSKARAIADRADSETENSWLELAADMSTAKLPRQLPAPAPAAAPVPTLTPTPVNTPTPHNPKPSTEKCHISYSLTPDEYQIWSNLNELLCKQHKGESKASLLLRGMAALNKEKKVPRDLCHTLLRIDLCPACNEATLQTSRGRFKAPKPLLEAARCDAVVEDQNSRRRNIISPRLRRAVLHRDGHCCHTPGCSHTQFLQIHHRVPSIQGGSTELDNLVTLCSSCHRALHEREEDLGRAARDPVT